MARGLKTGADYFPLDVEIFYDRKVMMLKNMLGFEAVSVYLALLCDIYSNKGYYMYFNEDDRLLIAERIGGGCRGDFVENVVRCCIQKDLFDAEIFEKYGVLTSKGIQERFLRICIRREIIHLEEDLLVISIDDPVIVPDAIKKKLALKSISANGNAINVDGNSVSVDRNTQSKVKNSKVKESKSSSATTTTNSRATEILELLPNSVKPEIAETICEGLVQWLDVFDIEVIGMAIEAALKYNGFNLSYIYAVLEDWRKNGIKSGKKPKKKSRFASYQGRAWDFEELRKLSETEIEVNSVDYENIRKYVKLDGT